MKYKIAIGTDHRGYDLKQAIIKVEQWGNDAIEWIDVGTMTSERTDYPMYADLVVEALAMGEADLGILLCGSGIGMAVAANRFPGIFAGVVWNEDVARMAKEDDNINVLVLPADFIDKDVAFKLIGAWLSARFKGGRYEERLAMIDAVAEDDFE